MLQRFYNAARGEDTVFMKDELNKLLRALGQRKCGVKRETATFFDLQRDKTHNYNHPLNKYLRNIGSQSN